MEVSALKYHAGVSRHGRSPLLRLQSDDHLIKLIRSGHDAAFEVLVSRYESRLLSFCRHLLGSREDAEDVLQEALSAAYNAILADERPINVRPWLYRIARNRCLNHLRRIQAIGVDSMDVLYAENGETTADKVHRREEFRLLVDDIHELPETQRTALILREMDALAYEQIAEAMETTVSSVKSLLVRARVSLAEASEARLLSCEAVRNELAAAAEGLVRRPGALERRHLKTCERCNAFSKQLKRTNRALGAMLPIGPFALFKAGVFSHISGHASHGAVAAGSAATGSAASATGVLTTTAGSASGFISAGVGALATKTAAGIAVAALVTAGAVATSGPSHTAQPNLRHAATAAGASSTASAAAHRAASVRRATAVSSSETHLAATHTAAHRHPTTLIATSVGPGAATPTLAGSGAPALTTGGAGATRSTTSATSGAASTGAAATSTPTAVDGVTSGTQGQPNGSPVGSGTSGDGTNQSLSGAVSSLVGGVSGTTSTTPSSPPALPGVPSSGVTAAPAPTDASPTTPSIGTGVTSRVTAAVSTVITPASATP